MKSARKINPVSNVLRFPNRNGSPNTLLVPSSSWVSSSDALGYHEIGFNKYHFMAGDKIIIKENFSEDELRPDSFVIANNKLTIFSLVEDGKQITGLVKGFYREVI